MWVIFDWFCDPDDDLNTTVEVLFCCFNGTIIDGESVELYINNNFHTFPILFFFTSSTPMVTFNTTVEVLFDCFEGSIIDGESVELYINNNFHTFPIIFFFYIIDPDDDF